MGRFTQGNNTTTDRNLASRMRVTMDSELEPEMVTPNTAGSEELPQSDEIFPLVKTFRQTNMGPNKRYSRSSQQGRGKDSD